MLTGAVRKCSSGCTPPWSVHRISAAARDGDVEPSAGTATLRWRPSDELTRARRFLTGREPRVYTTTRRSHVLEITLRYNRNTVEQALLWPADVALLTYRSAPALPDGPLHRHTLRSSIWQRSGWPP